MSEEENITLATAVPTAPGSNTQIGVVDVNYLLGQLLTQAEILGLPERQWKAYRGTISRMLWQWYNDNLENPTGLVDPSRQARVEAGIERDYHTTATLPGEIVTNV